MRIKCSRCGNPVSADVLPANTVIRAYIECPECIEKDEEAAIKEQYEEIKNKKHEFKDSFFIDREIDIVKASSLITYDYIYYESRIYESSNVVELLKIIKNNYPLVTINGCFDILTAGHLYMLRMAREQINIFYEELYISGQGETRAVLCGINSDKSVKANKGESRPILNERERARNILATGYVDYVYIYDEPTSAEFVRLFKPHIHVNDSTYGEDCVEVKIMQEYLPEFYRKHYIYPKLVLVDKLDCPSTTDIVNRIKG